MKISNFTVIRVDIVEYFRNHISSNFFALLHPGWQDRAIRSHLSKWNPTAMANNRADDRTSIDRHSQRNGERAPRDRHGKRAHPHSDVGLDKWTQAIKSIRRDMALSC